MERALASVQSKGQAVRLQAGGGTVRPKRTVGVRRHGRWQPAGVDALGAALELNSNLRALRIEGNWLGGRGTSSLAAALVRRGTLSHGSLTQLDLGANALLGDAIAAVTKLPPSKRGDKLQEQEQSCGHEQLQDHSQKLDQGEKQVRENEQAQDKEMAGNEGKLQRESQRQCHDKKSGKGKDLRENYAHEGSTTDGDKHVESPRIPENKQKMLRKRKEKQQLGRTITVPGSWCDDFGNVFNGRSKDVQKECWCDDDGNVITQQRNNVDIRNRPPAISEGTVGFMSGFTGRGTVDIMAERKIVTGVADMEISSTLHVGRMGPAECAAVEKEKRKEVEALNNARAGCSLLHQQEWRMAQRLQMRCLRTQVCGWRSRCCVAQPPKVSLLAWVHLQQSQCCRKQNVELVSTAVAAPCCAWILVVTLFIRVAASCLPQLCVVRRNRR